MSATAVWRDAPWLLDVAPPLTDPQGSDTIQTSQTRERKLQPYQRLAIAVIIEAFSDLQRALTTAWYSPGRLTKKHTQAASDLAKLDEWFADTAEWWCAVAGMDYTLVTSVYEEIRYGDTRVDMYTLGSIRSGMLDAADGRR